MTKQKMRERNIKVLEYRKTHTLFETAMKFDLSVNQIFRICKHAKLAENDRQS